ncbi:MAG: hypothetical protein HY321_18565 [Armatimonadetes bacterium]|nr:hypothetical protein [Armatimonadota bacterium]
MKQLEWLGRASLVALGSVAWTAAAAPGPGAADGAAPSSSAQVSDARLAERIYHPVASWRLSGAEGDAGLAKAIAELRRLKALGFTGVVLRNEPQLALPGILGDAAYRARLRQLGEKAARLGIDVIPHVMNFGNGQSLLAHDPNLAEGFPVKDALFVVKGREATLVPDLPLALADPGFEAPEGNRFPGWMANAGMEGKAVLSDTDVRHGGASSVRFEVAAAPGPQNNVQLSQPLPLTPFRLYRLSIWIKSEGLDPKAEVTVELQNGERRLHFGGLRAENIQGVAPTQDWTRHVLVFNSLAGGTGSLGLRVRHSPQGKVWFDDLAVEEVGMLNILRRPGCPLTVKGEDGTLYEEGRDFTPAKDPRLNRLHAWGGWSLSHEPPALELTAGSRLREGQRLRVSFYHAVPVYGHQVALCMSCPETYELFARGVKELEELLRPVGYHINVGECRSANWDADCQRKGLPLAQLLAWSVKERMRLIREINPRARIYGWSDMLDPYHNARDNYYLCNGTLVGGAEAAPKDLIILNWNISSGGEGEEKARSPRFFANLGYRQLLVNYGKPVREWLDGNPGVPGISGVYQFAFEEPEVFAGAVWGAGAKP